MKKSLLVLSMVGCYILCTGSAFAGLITHTDYQSGAVITSAGQNTNENTIYNEFNGNIDNTNIKTGGIVATNIANGTLTFTQLGTVLTSSITIAQSLSNYRRPVLVYNSVTVVNLETGLDGTSGEVTILFPDGVLRHDSTSSHIQVDISRNAQFVTGTIQSGLRTGSVANNTWYAVYAVKSQASSTDFVGVFDTLLPTQANFASLNTNFGTSAWIYLGLVSYGDGRASPTGIVKFTQAGNQTYFRNGAVVAATVPGVMLSSAAAATSLTYTYVSGTTFGTVPSTLPIVRYTVTKSYDASGRGARYVDAAAVYDHGYDFDGAASLARVAMFWVPASDGIQALDYNSGSANQWEILISAYIDSALGVGSNPLL